MAELFGGIEAGGTKFVCAVAEEGGSCPRILAETRVATRRPGETIAEVINFFREESAQRGPLAGVGIASFGPIDLDPTSPTYGYITSTPKKGWTDFDLLGEVRRGLDGNEMHVGFDTDVNGAALAEWRWGEGKGFDTFVYVTVGTGIGGGGMVGGRLIHGLTHPEMGHVFVPRHPKDDFEGTCKVHQECLSGYASGSALEQRWGMSPSDLPDDHPAWELECHYLAHGLANIALVMSPQVIVLGGGVMRRAYLYDLVRRRLATVLAGYVQAPPVKKPALAERAGVLGAIALARG